jgi:hypothetical protein
MTAASTFAPPLRRMRQLPLSMRLWLRSFFQRYLEAAVLPINRSRQEERRWSAASIVSWRFAMYNRMYVPTSRFSKKVEIGTAMAPASRAKSSQNWSSSPSSSTRPPFVALTACAEGGTASYSRPAFRDPKRREPTPLMPGLEIQRSD